MPRLRLRFESLRIEVTSADAEDLRWLAAFLDAGFEVPPGPARGEPDVRVTLAIDREACERAARVHGARGDDPGVSRVEGFAGDGKSTIFESLGREGPFRIYRQPGKGLVFRVADAPRRVEILAPAPRPRLRRTLMRVVRELAMTHAVADGAVLLHASAVRAQGGAIAICGPRRSGKTSLLVALLGLPGVRYVANDRCALRVEPEGTRVRGIPTLVSVRNEDGSDRPSLEPQAFCGAFAEPPSDGGSVAALVFPRITDDRERLTVRPLTPDEAIPRLRAGLFRAERERLLGPVFAPEEAAVLGYAALATLRPLERRIVTTVPCFDCRLGGGAPPASGHVGALRDLLRTGALPGVGLEVMDG